MITFESAKTIFPGSGAGMCEGECICEDMYMNTDLHVYMHVHVLLRMRCNLEFVAGKVINQNYLLSKLKTG